MIDYAAKHSFTERLKFLNDKLEFNLQKMEDLDSKNPTYRKLYLENEDIIKEVLGLIN